MYNQQLGRYGEQIAVNYLQSKGYRILVRNFQCKWGEIDIIATRQGVYYFVEVKTRTSLAKGRPEEALTYRKRRAFFQAAQVFVNQQGLRGAPWQLSVIAILLDLETNQARVKHIPNFSIDMRARYSVR